MPPAANSQAEIVKVEDVGPERLPKRVYALVAFPSRNDRKSDESAASKQAISGCRSRCAIKPILVHVEHWLAPKHAFGRPVILRR